MVTHEPDPDKTGGNDLDDVAFDSNELETALEGVTTSDDIEPSNGTGEAVNDNVSLDMLNQYSSEEIRDAVDVESIRIDTHVDKRYTTTPERGINENGEKRRVPPSRQELKWLAGAIDGGAQIDVHVRVLDIREYSNNDSAYILVADETAATEIEVPGQLRPDGDDQSGPTDEINPGDSVFISNVETIVATNDHYSELRYSFDTEIEVWDEWDRDAPVGVTVTERSQLLNAAERYGYEEKHVAREHVVDTVLDEFEIINPKDTDDAWIYTGDPPWEPGAEAVIKSKLNDVLPSQANVKAERNEIAEQVLLASQTHENPFTPGPPDDPDLKWCVPVQNGLIDLRKPPGQELIPHKPEHYTTQSELLEVTYDPDAECPGIMENLEKIATDDVMRRTIEEMIANIIMRNNDYRKTYIKYGDEKTAKSFIDKLVKWLVGEEAVEHMDFTKFVTDDFEADSARNSYAVIDDDASANKITKKQCAAFKKFVGDGGARTGAKHVQRESYDPYATIVMNVNNPPVWTGWDGSIKSRLLPLFFTNQFVADPDPNDPTEHKKVKSSELERELRTDEELSGLLNVVIEAANRLYETDEWSIYENFYEDMPGRDPEEAHERLIRKYRNYADTTRRFARMFMRETENPVEVRKEDWHAIYRRMCDEEGVEPQDPSKFWEQLRNDDTVYIETKNPYQSPRVTVYLAPTPKALEYAPAPVRDRIEGLVESPGFSVGVDETTPIRDLPRGEYATIEGEVVTKTEYGNIYSEDGRLAIVIEDESGGRISVLKPALSDDAEIIDEFDAVVPGDTVRVHSGITSTSEPTMKLQDGASSIDIISRPGGAGDIVNSGGDRGSDDESSGTSDGRESGEDGDTGNDTQIPQGERIATLKGIIEANESGAGAPVDDVFSAAEEHGLNRDTAEYELQKLKREGVVYEPQSGYLRTTSSGGEA